MALNATTNATDLALAASSFPDRLVSLFDLHYPLRAEVFFQEYDSYFLNQPEVYVGTFVVYGVACALVALFGKNRPAFHIPKWVLILHNVLQVLLSIVVMLGLAGGRWFADYSWLPINKQFDAERALQYPNGERMAIAFMRLFVLTKLYDLMDTVFIVLAKKDKQFTFLHCSHHCLVPIALWYSTRDSPSGDVTMSALVNSFVHTVMYSYYLCTSLGINCPWKQYITRIQLLQFLFLFIYGITSFTTGSISHKAFYSNTSVQGAMMILFGQFYRETYKNNKNSKNNKEQAKQD